MISILHNPSCSKSRCALDYSQEFPNLNISIRNYLEDPLSVKELKELLQKLDVNIAAIVRSSDKDFIEQFGDSPLSEQQYFEILSNFPRYLQRPILIDDGTAIIGRPPELILEYLQQKK